MIRNLYILLTGAAMLLSMLQSYAQNTISGRITTTDNKALPGANIVIRNSTLGTASDESGNYSIKGLKNGTHHVRVSFFGFETVEKTVELTGRDIILDVELEEASIDLSAVVITGTRTEKSLKNTPVLTQSIGIRELVSKDATDITQALEMAVPGIEFASTATGKSISLQGISPQYMLFLVDGERLAGETYGDIDYSRINMASVERIEVVKGAGSTLYGSNALGGVVNIITKTPTEKFSHSVATRFSKYNTQNYQFSVGARQGKVSSMTSVVMDKTDGYDLLEGNTYRTQEREDAFVLNENLKYAPSGDFLLEGNLSFMDKNHDNTATSIV